MPAHPPKRPQPWEVSIDPDAVAYWSPRPVVGYRVWAWSSTTIKGTTRHPWTTATVTARCLIGGQDRHGAHTRPIPHLRADGLCSGTCGINAFADPRRLLTEVMSVPWVRRLSHGLPPHGTPLPEGLYGVVELSGRVIEHEHGYRGERCTVVGLVLPDDTRVWSTSDPEVIADLFAHPDRPSPDEGWSSIVADRNRLQLTVANELERIGHGRG